MADDTTPGGPGQQPTPGQHPPGPQPAPGPWSPREDAPTEWVGTSQPPPSAAGGSSAGDGPDASGTGAGGRRRRRWIIPVAAVAAVALIGGGAFAAYSALSGGGPQPAEAIPASAMAYVRVDLDPSADQKINMVQLLRNVPQFEEETGITSDTDDLRRRLFEEALKGANGCPDVNYDDDIAPWIGDRAGAAAIPSDDPTAPDGLLVLQVTDEDAARDGFEALSQCDQVPGDEEADPGIAFVGDYALLAETQTLADDFAADAEEAPLSESDGFSGDMEALDGEGVMSFWLDLDALMDIAAEDDPESVETLEALGYDELGGLSAALRAQSDSIELVMAGSGDAMEFAGGSTESATDVQQLPDSTLVALGFTGGGEAVSTLWDAMGDLSQSALGEQFGPGDLDELAKQLQAQSGIALPDDLSVLLGEEFTLALDSEGLALDPATGQPDPSSINVGASIRTDAEAVRDLITRIQDLVAASSGTSFEIANTDIDNGIVLASNDEYAQQLADGGNLGDSDAFEAAVADADSATSVFFLDLDRLSEVATTIAADTGQPLPPEAVETLEVFQAFGVSSSTDGDYTRVTMRVVFD